MPVLVLASVGWTATGKERNGESSRVGTAEISRQRADWAEFSGTANLQHP